MSDLIRQYNLKQLIKEPTNFTEHSSSIIDLILVRISNNILSSAVIDPFIPDQTRYHCPIVVLLKFLHPKVIAFKRRVWNYKRAEFDKFRDLLSQKVLKQGWHPSIILMKVLSTLQRPSMKQPVSPFRIT